MLGTLHTFGDWPAGTGLSTKRPLATDAGYWDASGGRRATVKVIAIASLALGSCIMFAGRWIAYVASY